MCSEGSIATFIDFNWNHVPATDFRSYDIDDQLLFDGPKEVDLRPALPSTTHPLHKARQVVHMGQSYRPMIRRGV